MLDLDEKTVNELYRVGLYELATGLCNQASGASDSWPDIEVAKVDRYLRWRLENWRQTLHQLSKERDAATYNLVQAALDEYKKWGER